MSVTLSEEVNIPNKQGSSVEFGWSANAHADNHAPSASVIERNCNLDIDKPTDTFRKTHIICTLGMNSHISFQ